MQNQWISIENQRDGTQCGLLGVSKMWLASSWSVLELCPFRWQEMTQFKSTISDSRTVPIASQSFSKMWKLSVAVLKMATAEEQEVENGVKTWVGMGDDFSKKSSPMPTPFFGVVVEASDEDPRGDKKWDRHE